MASRDGRRLSSGTLWKWNKIENDNSRSPCIATSKNRGLTAPLYMYDNRYINSWYKLHNVSVLVPFHGQCRYLFTRQESPIVSLFQLLVSTLLSQTPSCPLGGAATWLMTNMENVLFYYWPLNEVFWSFCWTRKWKLASKIYGKRPT